MAWFKNIEEGDMMWDVSDEDCLEALRELRDAPSYEKCIVAEGNGHHVIFFEGRIDGNASLLEASVNPEWNAVNSGPDRTMAGRVENIFQFRDEWEDIYVSKELPNALN